MKKLSFRVLFSFVIFLHSHAQLRAADEAAYLSKLDYKKMAATIALDSSFQADTRAIFGTLTSEGQNAVRSSLRSMTEGRGFVITKTPVDSITAKRLADALLSILPDGNAKTSVSNYKESGDLSGLLLLTSGRAEASSPTGKLKTNEKHDIERRFAGTMWEQPGDTKFWTEFFFSKDGAVFRMTGPRTDQNAKTGAWKILDTGVVQCSGIAGRTYWFSFDSSDDGTCSEVQFAKDGSPIQGEKQIIRREPDRKLPRKLKIVP